MANEKIECDDLQCPDNKDGLCQREYEEESDKSIRTRLIAIECESFFQVFLDIENYRALGTHLFGRRAGRVSHRTAWPQQ